MLAKAIQSFWFPWLFREFGRNVSVNYQFGSPLIPSDFLTSNFRDMRNLMSVVFGLFRKMKKKALMNSRIPKFR